LGTDQVAKQLARSPLIEKLDLSATMRRPVTRAGRISSVVQTLNLYTGLLFEELKNGKRKI